ncbi:MAG TPA: hypothetical protein PK537_09815 [Candidatus Limiplasma sp.]|nr:hypothetical protein [Candidatus Limiplasma sp.]
MKKSGMKPQQAVRPVFAARNAMPYCLQTDVEFAWYAGSSVEQWQVNIRNLHEAYRAQHPGRKILEISSKSDTALGAALSAFHLRIATQSGGSYTVEAAYQSSKVFENGGPYQDLLYKAPWEVKRDRRLRESGRLKRFLFENREFGLNPTTYFYHWLYMHALAQHPEYVAELLQYDAFTDIAFNPEKSVSCQARTAAVFVSLHANGLLSEALQDTRSFLQILYSDAASRRDA